MYVSHYGDKVLSDEVNHKKMHITNVENKEGIKSLENDYLFLIFL